MSDRMRTIPFGKLVNWILEEYRREKTIFGISEKAFYRTTVEKALYIHGEKLGSPIGPAAGPHTQLAQNLAAAYLCGGRYFELKTVQVLDCLNFAKPCINAADEGYNTEWSTELSIEEALSEYIKGWFLLHLLAGELFDLEQRDFVFNMSIGYNLEGIRSAKVDRFIEGMKNASSTETFNQCRAVLHKEAGRFNKISGHYVDSINPQICQSVALSTMHGCPPSEIEAISKHLLLEKRLHTTVKLNPTLLGYDFVRSTLDRMGYGYIRLTEETFTKDLQYSDALPLLDRLISLAAESNLEFAVKVSNTLPVMVARAELPGEQMYLSGRPLYALTISLAERLAGDFGDKLKISFSGGADRTNTAAILETGISPVTMVTTLLKPSGYRRLQKLAEIAGQVEGRGAADGINLDRLKTAAAAAVDAPAYRKKETGAVQKPAGELPLFDCRGSCGICVAVCPNRANVTVSVRGANFKFERQILHLDGSCNECGNCATFCPEIGRPYLEKPTLFRDHADFEASSNSGFVIIGDGFGAYTRVRVKDRIFVLPPGHSEKEAPAVCDPAFIQLLGAFHDNYLYLC